MPNVIMISANGIGSPLMPDKPPVSGDICINPRKKYLGTIREVSTTHRQGKPEIITRLILENLPDGSGELWDVVEGGRTRK